MFTKQISINTIKDMMDFVNEASKVFGDVLIRKGKYVIDGKSIMGILSIDPSTGITIEYPEDATDFETFLTERF